MAAFGGLTEQKQTFAVRRPDRRVRPDADIQGQRPSSALLHRPQMIGSALTGIAGGAR
jgi:hypothetical protein